MADVLLKDVEKRFDRDVVAVKNTNLEVKDREFVVLVGPSGCGKSTTLRMIAGLEEVTRGEIYIDRRLVNDVPPKDRDIAMVFQNYALYPHMSVYQNMAFGLKLRKYPRHEIEQRVQESAAILGIGHLLERKPKALSGGERQRVAVGRAIVRKPKVFLFDEPLSNLDAKLRVQMRTEIRRLHRRLGATMIYVTHDQVEAMTMGDRIVVMRDGEIQQIADPIRLYNKPTNRFVAGFIGSPSMNFLEGRLEQRGDTLLFTEGQLQLVVPDAMKASLQRYTGQPITFGIRPEDLFLPKTANHRTGEKIQVMVDVVEPMGNETFLYLSTGQHVFVARVESYERPTVNTQLELLVDVNKAHFFDSQTTMTIV